MVVLRKARRNEKKKGVAKDGKRCLDRAFKSADTWCSSFGYFFNDLRTENLFVWKRRIIMLRCKKIKKIFMGGMIAALLVTTPMTALAGNFCSQSPDKIHHYD